MKTPEWLTVVRAIERRGAVVLTGRILQVWGRIFCHAVATSRATRDPAQDLRGALKSPGLRNRRATLPASELPAFLKALETYQGDRVTALALTLTLHTMLRTQVGRFGRWAEIEGHDGSMPLWHLPAERANWKLDSVKYPEVDLEKLIPAKIRILVKGKESRSRSSPRPARSIENKSPAVALPCVT